MKQWFLAVIFLLLASLSLSAEIILKDITVTPRWPWNGLVDITYSVEFKEMNPTEFWVDCIGMDYVRNQSVLMKTVTGEGIDTPVTADGFYTITWDAGKDAPPGFNSTAFTVRLTTKQYLVINLLDWSYGFRLNGPDLSDDTCRTTELWLRGIPAGTFLMGSPENELGRDDETQHQVTLTQDFYIGVFEMTQRQYELVMGSGPSSWGGDTRPVEGVSYDNLRGTSEEGGAGWPSAGHAVDASSFFGVLRAKTGLLFDLPTEAQWEYACRAGTTTALNSGKNLTATGECPNMSEVGRYYFNQYDGKGGYSQATKVGCYLPNAWGLYDMHGNVMEWCLDWRDNYPADAVTDPLGADSGSLRMVRGGHFSNDAQYCRSAHRYYSCNPSHANATAGFRVVCLP